LQKKRERSSKSSSKFQRTGDSGTTPDSIYQRDSGTPDSVDALIGGSTPPKFIIGDVDGSDVDNVSQETGPNLDVETGLSEQSSLDGDVLLALACEVEDFQEGGYLT
jgi:hypothetical protein